MAKVKGSTATKAPSADATTTSSSSSSGTSSSSGNVKGKQPQYVKEGIGSTTATSSSSSRFKGIGSSLSEYANKLKYGLYEKEQASSPLGGIRQKSGGAATLKTSTGSTFKLLNWRTASQTLAYYLVLMSFGFSIGALGPSIPVLSYLSKTPLPKMGWIFTMRGIGAILGSIIGGKVYDSWYSRSKRGANLFLATSTLLLAACVAAIPLASSYGYQLSIYFAFGLLGGLVNMGCNLLLVWMWEASVSGIILAMNAFSGIGSFLGAMFIARSSYQFASLYFSMGGVLVGAATFLALTQVSRLRTKGEYKALEEVTTTGEEEFEEEEELEEEEETPAAAEVTIVEQQPSAIDQEGGNIDLEQEQEQELEQEIGKKYVTPGSRKGWIGSFHNMSLALVIGVAMFGAVALETTFGGLITTYLRAKSIARSYEEVALMNASFWLSLTFTRLTAAVLSRWLRPGFILSLSINGVFGALAIFLLGPQMPITGWLGCMLMGASVASMYPLALSYPETSMGIPLTGAMTTLMLVFASAAEMIIPIAVTSSFRTVGADALFWTLLGVAVSTFAAYSTMITWSFVKNLRVKPVDSKFAEENESLIYGRTPESLKGTPVTPGTTPISPIATEKRLATADELLFQERTPQTPA